MTVGWGWDVGRWSALTLFISENRAQRETHTKKNLPSPSLFYSFLPTTTTTHERRSAACQRMAWYYASVSQWCSGQHDWWVWGKCEGQMSDSVNTHTCTSTYNSTHSWCKGFLLTAPVPYRHHPLLLVSNPGIRKKKKGGGEVGKEWDSEEDDKKWDPCYWSQIYASLHLV